MQRISKMLVQAVLLLITAVTFAGAQEPTDVLSEVNGTKITRAELEEKRGKTLHQARYQLYTAEQKALEEVIDEHLLQAEANRQKLTVDQLLDREVKAAVPDPNEEQLQLYYELSQAKQPYETLRDKIFQVMRQSREAKARAAYLQRLREAGNVLVMLAPPKAEFDLAGSPRFGSDSAPIQLVEFADYECPYCIKAHPQIKRLREEFAGKITMVFKDLPLPNHSRARKAAEASRCAGAQGKYWEYHDVLFSGAGLDVPQLKQHARGLNMDGARFDQCLDSGEFAAVVQKDYQEALELGVKATPTFYLNNQFFQGALDYETLRNMVNKELARKQMEGREVSQTR